MNDDDDIQHGTADDGGRDDDGRADAPSGPLEGGDDELREIARAAMEHRVEGITAGGDLLRRVTAGLDAADSPLESTGARSGLRRRAPLLVAAALAMVLGALVTWNRLTPDHTAVIGGPGPGGATTDPGPSTPASAAVEPRCSTRVAFVYLEPTVTEDQRTDVDQALSGIAGIASAEYWDLDRSYAEFQELFAEQPDLLASVAPEDLPTSFRVELAEDLRGEDWPNGSPAEGSPWQRIEELPGVLRVTATGDHCRARQQTSPTATEPVIEEAPLPLAAEAPPMPHTVVGVREDGWLLAVDLLTAEQTKLAFHGDPAAKVEFAAQTMYIDAVSVDPVGGWVYYSTCCEPAAGITYRVRLDGSSPQPEELGGGAYPSVSPDGRWVAVGVAQDIRVFDATDPSKRTRMKLDGSVSQIAWSPAGDRLMVNFGEPQRSGAAQLVGFNGVDEPLDDLGPIEGADLIGFTPTGEPDPTATGDGRQSMRTKTQDASAWWTLWVKDPGELYTGEVFDPEKRIGRGSLPSFMTADW